MHVEAGLRTGGNNLTPFPEELNRQLISRIAGLHFAPTAENLREPRARERPGRPDLRDRQHRHRRAAVGADARRAVRRPRSCRRCTTATSASSWSPRTGGRTGATASTASPRASRRLAAAAARRALRAAAAPEPAVREALDRAPRRHRQRAADRAARLRHLRPPARARAPRDHRLRRHPGGGAVARQAGAGAARDHRAHRGRRGRHAAAGRHRPRPDLRRGHASCSTTPSPTPRWPTAANPYGDGQAADRIVAALEHVLLGGDPPAPFGPGYSRADDRRAPPGSTCPPPATAAASSTTAEAVGEYVDGGVTRLALHVSVRGPAGRLVQVLFCFALLVIVAVDCGR